MTAGTRHLLMAIAAALALVACWLGTKDFGIGAVVLAVAGGIGYSALPTYRKTRRRGKRR